MRIEHDDSPSLFDPDRCRPSARQAGLLHHYDRVQHKGARLRQLQASAAAFRRHAVWALGSFGVWILPALLPVLSG
jgi:hypothetical protein